MQMGNLGPLLMPSFLGARGNNRAPLKYMNLHGKPLDPPDTYLSTLWLQQELHKRHHIKMANNINSEPYIQHRLEPLTWISYLGILKREKP
jgi:hypothetical protein